MQKCKSCNIINGKNSREEFGFVSHLNLQNYLSISWIRMGCGFFFVFIWIWIAICNCLRWLFPIVANHSIYIVVRERYILHVSGVANKNSFAKNSRKWTTCLSCDIQWKLCRASPEHSMVFCLHVCLPARLMIPSTIEIVEMLFHTSVPYICIYSIIITCVSMWIFKCVSSHPLDPSPPSRRRR